ncbi:unnamed protein product, partial [Mesorhabditis spiculigera]
MPLPGSVELKRPDLKGEFTCGACRKSFCHISSLNRHRVNFHSSNRHCRLCDAPIPVDEHLRSHMSQRHQIEQVFTCSCCNWAFPDKKQLNMHIYSMSKTGQPGPANVIATVDLEPGAFAVERPPSRRASGPAPKSRQQAARKVEAPAAEATENPVPALADAVQNIIVQMLATQLRLRANGEAPAAWFDAFLANNPALAALATDSTIMALARPESQATDTSDSGDDQSTAAPSPSTSQIATQKNGSYRVTRCPRMLPSWEQPRQKSPTKNERLWPANYGQDKLMAWEQPMQKSPTKNERLWPANYGTMLALGSTSLDGLMVCLTDYSHDKSEDRPLLANLPRLQVVRAHELVGVDTVARFYLTAEWTVEESGILNTKYPKEFGQPLATKCINGQRVPSLRSRITFARKAGLLGHDVADPQNCWSPDVGRVQAQPGSYTPFVAYDCTLICEYTMPRPPFTKSAPNSGFTWKAVDIALAADQQRAAVDFMKYEFTPPSPLEFRLLANERWNEAQKKDRPAFFRRLMCKGRSILEVIYKARYVNDFDLRCYAVGEGMDFGVMIDVNTVFDGEQAFPVENPNPYALLVGCIYDNSELGETKVSILPEFRSRYLKARRLDPIKPGEHRILISEQVRVVYDDDDEGEPLEYLDQSMDEEDKYDRCVWIKPSFLDREMVEAGGTPREIRRWMKHPDRRIHPNHVPFEFWEQKPKMVVLEWILTRKADGILEIWQNSASLVKSELSDEKKRRHDSGFYAHQERMCYQPIDDQKLSIKGLIVAKKQDEAIVWPCMPKGGWPGAALIDRQFLPDGAVVGDEVSFFAVRTKRIGRSDPLDIGLVAVCEKLIDWQPRRNLDPTWRLSQRLATGEITRTFRFCIRDNEPNFWDPQPQLNLHGEKDLLIVESAYGYRVLVCNEKEKTLIIDIKNFVKRHAFGILEEEIRLPCILQPSPIHGGRTPTPLRLDTGYGTVELLSKLTTRLSEDLETMKQYQSDIS